MSEAYINNKSLYYNLTEPGECLVLIHSALTDSRLWQPQRAEFSRHYQVLTYDLYGYGKSIFTDEKKIEHADDLAALLDGLNVEKAHILGASMGGEIAQRFSLEYPQRVRSLILAGTGLEGYDYPEDAFGWWGLFEEAMQANDFHKASAIFIQNALNSPEAPLKLELITQLQTIIKDYTFRHYIDNTLLWKDYGTPTIERLNEIRCPTLVIVGQADTSINRAIAQLLAKEISGASLVTVPDAAHLPSLQQSERFNAAVLNFLNSLKRGT
jgi:3-oxoadipate enol-lactonase